jgi:RNA recognition motif-containing protein
MTSKLFVGNISYDFTTNELHDKLTEVFSQYGEIKEIKTPTFPDTGKQKGYAFITFGTPEEAQTAMDALQGVDLAPVEGKIMAMRLDFADDKPRESRDGGGRGGSKPGFRPNRFKNSGGYQGGGNRGGFGGGNGSGGGYRSGNRGGSY